MALQTDRIFLSNDNAAAVLPGEYYHQTFQHTNFLTNETSAHGSSAAVQQSFIATQNGHIVDAQIGVVRPAVSASGFVSGTCDLNLRINSVALMSTNPRIDMQTSSNTIGRFFTGGGAQNASAQVSTIVSGVVNTASAVFSTGDMISVDWNARSVGSAAATSSGVGFYAAITVRYSAI